MAALSIHDNQSENTDEKLNAANDLDQTLMDVLIISFDASNPLTNDDIDDPFYTKQTTANHHKQKELGPTMFDGEETILTRVRSEADNAHDGQKAPTVSFEKESFFFEIPYDITILASNIPNKGQELQNADFLGYCMDSGAARSVVGRNQYTDLCRELGRRLHIETSSTQFKFGQSRFPSKGKFLTRLKLSADTFLEFEVEIVNGDFPLLIGLEVWRTYELRLDFGMNSVSDSTQQWSLYIFYRNDHLSVKDATKQILFTRPELEKLHFHFQHCSTGKLYALLKRHDPTKATNEMKHALEDIAARCQTCSEYQSSPFRFRAPMPPDEILSNHELAMGLVWLEKDPVLHIVDTHTFLQNAEFIRGKTPNELW